MITEDTALHIASSLYHQLKPDEEYVMVIQNAVLFVKPFRSFLLYIACFFIFYLIHALDFSVFSLLLFFFSIQMIPSGFYYGYLMEIYNCFNFKTNQEKYLISKPLPLDHLCVLTSIIMLEVNQFLDYYVRAVRNGQLIDISVLLLIFSFTFYVLHKLGDALIVWLTLHIISFIPAILTKRIAFKITNFPAKLENRVLKKLRTQIQEEEIYSRMNIPA